MSIVPEGRGLTLLFGFVLPRRPRRRRRLPVSVL